MGGVLFAQANLGRPTFISAGEKREDPGTYEYVVNTRFSDLRSLVSQDDLTYTYYWGYGFVAGSSDVECGDDGLVLKGAEAYKEEFVRIEEENNDPDFFDNILFEAFNPAAATISITPTSNLFAPYSINNPEEKIHTLCVYVGYKEAAGSKNIQFITRDITQDIHNGLATNAQSANGDDSDDDDETASTTTSKSITKGSPTILNLYSSIWGAERINTTDANQEAVSGLIQKFFTRFFRVIFTVSGILMVVMLAVHGTQMIYAEFTGNVSGFSDAKKRVVAAAIGTIILLLSWIILDFIDPSLLRPQLFKTITQLREVGQGNNLVTANLSVPDKAVNYDKETGLLTISACPDIEDNFKGQVESVRQSLQQGPYSTTVPLQYHYQILYSDFGGEVKVSEEGEDRAFDKIRDQSEGGDSLVGVRKCTSEPQTKIKATIKNSDIIAVFPIVSIVVKKDEKDPGKVVKFWRGKPWRHKPKFDADDCITLGKEKVKLSGNITVAQGITRNQNGEFITIDFPAIQNPGRIFSSVEGIVTGYHIDSGKVQYCTKKDSSDCTTSKGVYSSTGNGKKVTFKITDSTAGPWVVKIGEVNHNDIFRITPMLVLVNEKGKKTGQCKEPLRGETACFLVLREGNENSGKLSSVAPPVIGCPDENTRGSARDEVKQGTSVPAGVPIQSSLQPRSH